MCDRFLEREREGERERETETEAERQRQRDRDRRRERWQVGAMILATFLINTFFLVFYANIQASCSKARMEYFNIKIRLLIRQT